MNFRWVEEVMERIHYQQIEIIKTITNVDFAFQFSIKLQTNHS